MNKFLKYTALTLAGALLAACVKEIDPEPIEIQKPIDMGDAYYARLREYKKSKHQIAFGWFGRWTAEGTTGQKYLSSAPDSMDIISIWGKHDNLTPAQIKDLRYVQQVKGTRVTFTVFSHNMVNLVGDALENKAENIPAAAKMLADTILKYGYDGIDFDHECGGNDLLYNKENMTTLLREMRTLLGPDKLIMVDGHVGYITEEGWSYANYAVQQAYGQSSGSAWNSVKQYLTPDRFILTENFEDFWSGGGKLLQQAAWNPDEGVKGGCGTYHMEYEYAHSDEPYKWIRQAIQIMNPAQNEVVWMKKERTENVVFTESGLHIGGGTAIPMQAQLFRPVEGLRIGVEYDPSLVDLYNEEHGTAFAALPKEHLSYPEWLEFEQDAYRSSSEAVASILNPSEIGEGEFLAAFRLCPAPEYGSKEVKIADDAITYLRVNFKKDNIELTLSKSGLQNIDALIPASDVTAPVERELTNITLSLNYNALEDLTIAFKNDPAAVAAYNEVFGTSYTIPDLSHLKISSSFFIKTGEKKSSPVTVKMTDLQTLPDGDYLFALRPIVEKTESYGCDEQQVLYLHIAKSVVNVNSNPLNIEGLLLDRTGWNYTLESNVASLNNPALMFDGNTTTGWYTAADGRSTVTVDMAEAHKLAGFRLSLRSNYKANILKNIETSVDGENWTTQALKISNIPIKSGHQYLEFYNPVTCRYIRMTYTGIRSGCSEFGAYEIQ